MTKIGNIFYKSDNVSFNERSEIDQSVIEYFSDMLSDNSELKRDSCEEASELESE